MSPGNGNAPFAFCHFSDTALVSTAELIMSGWIVPCKLVFCPSQGWDLSGFEIYEISKLSFYSLCQLTSVLVIWSIHGLTAVQQKMSQGMWILDFWVGISSSDSFLEDGSPECRMALDRTGKTVCTWASTANWVSDIRLKPYGLAEQFHWALAFHWDIWGLCT